MKDKESFWWCKPHYSDELNNMSISYIDKRPLDMFLGSGETQSEIIIDARKLDIQWDYDSSTPTADFLLPGPSNLTVSDRVYQLFRGIIEDSIKSFRFSYQAVSYVSFRPKIFLDLFDYELSRYNVLSSGTISKVQSITLTHRPESEINIFGFEGDRAVRRKIIVSDEFKRIYDDNELTGLIFKEVSVSA